VVREEVARLALSGAPDSVGVGRRFVRSTLDEWGHGHLVETAGLLVSELVTNAVLHARSAPEVVVRLRADVVRVEVVDGSPRLPQAKGYGVESATGRGLLLIDRLAAAWGTERRTAGKIVWFELALAQAAGLDGLEVAGAAAAAVDLDDLDALAASFGGWDDPPPDPRDGRTLACAGRR
jgi:anti-sigma regulatory factor (Ser/Thr protein kinase)